MVSYAPIAKTVPYFTSNTAASYHSLSSSAKYPRPPNPASYHPDPQPQITSIPYAATTTTPAPSPYQPAMSSSIYYPSVSVLAYPSASAPAVPMESNYYNSYPPSASPSYQYLTTTVVPPTTPSYYVYPTTATTQPYPYLSTAVVSWPSIYPARPAQPANTYSYAFPRPNRPHLNLQ